MTDFRTSTLIKNQLPEFIRDEYPKFVSFLNAYYEFLEKKQSGKNNDLINQTKSLREVSDIDSSLEEFERSFYEKFATLLPRDTVVRKDILFKNLTNLYLSKGNVESYKFLFRMLFDEELEIVEPKNEVLRASASTWSVESSLRVDPETLYAVHYGNGNKTTFLLPKSPLTVVKVLIDDVETKDYLVNKSYHKIIFDNPPPNNSTIKIFFQNFDFELLLNRKVYGINSKASGIVERYAVSLVSNRNIEDLYINSKTLIGQFENGEYCYTDVFIDENLLRIEFLTSSSLRSINVVEGGSNYSNGSIVQVSGGGAEQEAVAIIDEVFSGYIDTIVVDKPGAGFSAGGLIDAISPKLIVNGSIQTVNTTATNVVNSYIVFSDLLISNLTPLSIDTADYNIPGKSINKNSRIIDAYNQRTLTVGQIANCIVISSNSISTSIPIVEAEGAIYFTGSQKHSITGFGSLGGYQILEPGNGYKIGDEIIFGPNPQKTFGVGAAARVTSVDGNGGIQKIAFEPMRIRGYANVSTNNHIVTGTGTKFLQDIAINDKIMVNGEIRTVNTIVSDTQLRCTVGFTYDTVDANFKVGLLERYPNGGILYTQNNFPTTTVESRAGTGAQVIIDSLMGDGENLTSRGSKLPGAIVRIRIVDGGRGYKYIPFINLSESGDGKATAVADIESSFVNFEGKWTTSDSIISSTERKIQGRDYYVDYSYVTSSKVEFRKYKKILKDLLHPAGLINYARFKIDTSYDVNGFDVVKIDPTKTLSGKVNIGEGSIYLSGYGTNFIKAYNKGYIGLGDAIDVEGRIYIVDSINSETNIKVSPITSTSMYSVSPVPFQETSNGLSIIVLGTLYSNQNTVVVASGTSEITTEDGLDNISTESSIVITTE